MADPVVWPMAEHPEDLGEPERIYRQATAPKATTILRLLLLLVLLLAIGYGAYKLIHASSQWPESNRTCYLPIALLVLAFCALFLSAPALQKYGQLKEQRRDVVVVCSGGVACYHDGAWRSAKWNEIAEIKTLEESAGKDLMKEAARGGSDVLWPVFWGTIGGLWTLLGGDYRNYLITTKAGAQIELGETLTGIDKLMDTIQYRTEPLRLASVRQVLESGRAVEFGPITITKDWLNYNGKRLAWETIDSIEDEPLKTYIDPVSEMVLGGTIPVLRISPRPTLQPRGLQTLLGVERVDIPKQDVPNVQVLLTVANDMIRLAKRPKAQKA